VYPGTAEIYSVTPIISGTGKVRTSNSVAYAHS